MNEILQSKEYDFLTTNSYLNKNVCLLCLGGSRAYGTNTENSDWDIRGFATNNVDEIIGIKPDWETVVDTNTDTTIYSLKKLVKLLINSNPNVIEILGVRDCDVFFENKIGQLLRKNAKIFLSKKCLKSFRSYANNQFSRMYNFHSKNHQDQNLIEH